MFRSDVPDEPVLRRRIYDIRPRRDRVHGVRPGGPRRSHDLHISKVKIKNVFILF